MAVRFLLAAFLLYSNIILPISVKARNVSVISEDLSDEVFSGFNFNNGNTHLSGLENHTIHAPECDCGHNAIGCRYDETNGKICFCKDGYSQKDGQCESCYCGYGSKCTFINNKKTCYCQDNYAEKRGYCEACDCGKWGSKRCRFVNDIKYCHCDLGFVERDGKCESCDCGKIWSFSSCSFTAGDNKTCNCNNGYVQRNDTCIETCKTHSDCLNGGFCRSEEEGKFCRCVTHFTGDKCEINVVCQLMRNSCIAIGAECKYNKGMEKAFCECPSNTAFNKKRKMCEECYCEGNAVCTFEDGVKTCHCKKGYALNGDKCEECDCGYNGKSCKFENKLKVCTCRKNSAYFSGSQKCEDCSCGYYTTSCELNADKYTRCTCAKGYIVVRSKSNEDESCEISDKSCPSSESNNWIIATHALIGILSMIIFMIIFCCILKACCRKRKTSKKAAASSETGKDIEPSNETTVV